MTVRVQLHGRRVKALVGKAARRGLRKGGEHLLGEAKKLVPIEEATLERSGAVTVEGDECAVSFDTVYAVRQHEELTWKHDAGRSAKYLEIPAITEAGQIFEIMRAEVRATIEGGGAA